MITIVIGLMRPPAWGYPPPYYSHYEAAPARGGAGFFLLLLVLGVVAIVIMHNAQNQRNRLPVAKEIPVERSYDRYDDSRYADWGD